MSSGGPGGWRKGRGLCAGTGTIDDVNAFRPPPREYRARERTDDAP
ncbi:hypothetical protein KCH_77990 [Kitasatospora cheerisanensis KCTC 2395]|uniref:Uncharacterized protein n=1 Tax=Kitasatospora cheerisanensis KCTC 2395 TaxID=1348663 RepID=A0A066YH03_9ACTN|nr:hypothetical protein KCH_77990 [Kitasatospora cheerisanensis KCTC 2395]